MEHGAGGGAIGTASQAALTVHFDATAHSYTITYPHSGAFNGSHQIQTFVPADIQASADPNVTIYSHTSNSAIGVPETDTLFLTKNSAGTLTYVGAGFSLRGYEGTLANQHVAVTAFSYGINTTDAALPRSGAATFAVTLLGGYTHKDIALCGACDVTQWFVGRLTGTGTVAVNFGTGTLAMLGVSNEFDRVTGAAGPDMAFAGTGTIAALTNNFNGVFTYGAGATGFTGNWLGRFYGPNAEELGATFYATNSAGGTGSESVIGAIIGKRGAISTGANVGYDGFGGWTSGAAIPADVAAAIGPRAGAGAPSSDAAPQARLPRGAAPEGVRGTLRETGPALVPKH